MRIVFDISRLYVNQTGIGTCIRNLQAALGQIAPPDMEFIYVKPNYIVQANYKKWLPHPLAKVAEHGLLNWWYQVDLPLRLRHLKADLLFSPDPASPVFAPCPTVITLYDMLVDIYPQFYGRVWRWLYHLFDQNALKRAAAIICISHTTQQDLVRMLGVEAGRTQVIPIAADPVFQPLAEACVGPTLVKFGLTAQKYLLFVGGTNPRKNLQTLLKAFQVIAPRWPALRLVIVGVNADPNKSGSQVSMGGPTNQEWQTSYNIPDELKAALIAPGYVSQDDLVALYNGATALVFPSLYEGFGLPPLEAMACGCPVAAANTGALPEVVGEAALLCDPTQPAALVAQLEKLLNDPHLRLALQAAGFAQTKKFDWLTTANRTLQLLREVSNAASY